jgi:hypothetical protein
LSDYSLALPSARKLFVFVVALLLVGGCAAPQKKYERVQDAYLQSSGGPVVVVDVCVFQDAIGDADDYHMVTESKLGAERIAEVAREYLLEKSVPVKAMLVPYACGVIGTKGNEPQLARLDLTSPALMTKRPFAPSGEIAGNEPLIDALNVLATSAYERALTESIAAISRGRGQQLPPMKIQTPEEIKAATALVRTALKADSLIYFSVQGYSQSGGKAFAMGTGRVLVGLATGLATGIAFIPGGTTDGSLFTVAVFDLKDGEIRRSSASRGLGDPKKPDVVSDKRFVIPVLHGLLHREVTAVAGTETAKAKVD